MKCPNCKRKLLISGYSEYESLIEHVTDPNGLRSTKPEYRCVKTINLIPFFRCYPRRIFWDEFGDVYIPPGFIQRMFWLLNIYGVKCHAKVPNAIK